MALSDRIRRGDVPRPPRVMLYGVAGIGKTTFGTESEDPVFVPTEEGSNLLRTPHFEVAQSFDEFMGNLQALLSEEHKFRTVVIDTVDWLQRLIWRKVCETGGKSNIEDFGYGKGYELAITHWSALVAMLDLIRHHRGMQVILLAHADIVRYNDPASDGWDRYQPRLHKKAAAILIEWCDCVLFANHQVYTRKTSEDKRARTVGVGTNERVLHTVETPSHIAKNRWSLPPTLPFDEGKAYATFAAHRNAFFARGAVPVAGPAHTLAIATGESAPPEESAPVVEVGSSASAIEAAIPS